MNPKKTTKVPVVVTTSPQTQQVTRSLTYLQSRLGNAAISIANKQFDHLEAAESLQWCKCLDILVKLIMANDLYNSALLKGESQDLSVLSTEELVKLAQSVASKEVKS